MKKPTITEVRGIVEAHGARQGVVLLFDGERFAGVSYGATKAECARVAKLLDAIVDNLKAAKLPLP